jgi:hypothetical protein
VILRPKNWKSFQHYKDRSPPWIKLHRDLLNNFEFSCLPLASKALAPLLWLLASESESGEINLSSDALAFRLHVDSKTLADGLKGLIEKGFFALASGSLADCSQSAIPEREGEGEGETETEAETEAEVRPKAAPSDQPTDIAKAKADRAERLAAVTEDAIETFNASPFTVANGGRVPNVTKVNREKRRQQVARAIRVIREICTEEFGAPEITRDFWLGYWQIVNGDAFASGRQAGTGAHSNWRPDFEYLTRPDTITALWERAEAAA